MNQLKPLKWIAILLCFAMTSACAQTNAGHENFKRFISFDVGQSLYNRTSVANGRKPLSIFKLSNGNDEYRYLLYNANLGRPPCTVIYEVDPKNEIVVRSSFIGDEKGCVIVP